MTTLTPEQEAENTVWLADGPARCETTTSKIKVEGVAPVYLHQDHLFGAPVRHGISAPGKYKDAGIGNLLERVVDEINGVAAQ
jgi:hypothetical protein